VDSHTVDFHSLVKYDHTDGSSVRFDYGDRVHANEAPFARRIGAESEDDGYVVTIVTDADLRSQCWVFSARDISGGPIAKIGLPTRVPAGFHAKWIPGTRLWA
jgi:carotenoid cleavage dioxygenase